MTNNIVFFGETNFRNQMVKFGIKLPDRRQHVYVIGKSGTGKTTLLENMAIADIQAGRGLAVIDPHGEFAEKMLDFVPEDRVDDVIYFNPADIDHPIAFNPLESVSVETRHLAADGIMAVFKKLWPDVWSARMEYILKNTLVSLLEFPSSTLLGIIRMLSDKEYRTAIVAKLEDPVIKAFWVNEFAKYNDRYAQEATAAIQNKVGQFVFNPLIRNIIGQPKSTINMREIMDNRKILIANLSKGRMGEDNSAMLGAMLITKIQLAAMSRVDITNIEDRKDFYLYVDEFQNFSTESFANILSEARKYRLNLTLAHQYINQLDEKVRDAVFGNVGTQIAFRVGPDDSEFLERVFAPSFMANDLTNLSNHNIYVKLLIDGFAAKSFSAYSLPPIKREGESIRDVIIENSRNKYAVKKAVIEGIIAKEWLNSDSEEIADELTSHRGEHSLGSILKPYQPKEVRKEREKRDVNVDDLKKAISASLVKKSADEIQASNFPSNPFEEKKKEFMILNNKEEEENKNVDFEE